MKLNYFDNGVEIKGGCYHEFVKGKWDGKTFWSDDSLMLDDDILNDLNVAGLFFPLFPPMTHMAPLSSAGNNGRKFAKKLRKSVGKQNRSSKNWPLGWASPPTQKLRS